MRFHGKIFFAIDGAGDISDGVGLFFAQRLRPLDLNRKNEVASLGYFFVRQAFAFENDLLTRFDAGGYFYGFILNGDAQFPANHHEQRVKWQLHFDVIAGNFDAFRQLDFQIEQQVAEVSTPDADVPAFG